MRPLTRLLIRRGVTFVDLSNVLRRLFVEVADREFRIAGRKQSVSRVAILTGITRREVSRVLANPEQTRPSDATSTRPERLLTGWMRDSAFLDEDHKPGQLPFRSEAEASFMDLVRKYGGDVPARAMLDELCRVGVVSVDSEDRVSLLSPGYAPAGGTTELLEASFGSVGDLVSTIDHNDQQTERDNTRLQLTVNYDNLSEADVEAFRVFSRDKCRALLSELDKFLAARDRDETGEPVPVDRMRCGVGLFYFAESLNEQGSQSQVQGRNDDE